ncbi:hypothetical protein HRbin15_00547 [bacterium HR15]|nr:hypothetical protein HRbin15_00547 [bacterium HR15]
MAIWAIRALWILGLVALIAEMFLLANPRYRVPGPNDWESFEGRRFSIRKPKRFRAGDVVFGRFFTLPNIALDTDDVGFYRGRRTGFEVYFEPLQDTSNPLSQLMPPSSPNVQVDFAALMRKRHDERIAALRDDPSYVNFRELRRSTVMIRGVRGIRSDYEYVLPHPIPLFNMHVRGYVLTAPLSEREVIHIHAYCPSSSYDTYQQVFDQMLATLTLKKEGGAQ